MMLEVVQRSSKLLLIAGLSPLLSSCTMNNSFAPLTSFLQSGSGIGRNSTINQSANFQSIKNEILNPKCLSCHSSTVQAGGISFADYASTLKAVIPGNALASRLYASTKSGSMPQGGPRLDDVELRNIELWILAGAKNDAPTPSPGMAFSPVTQPELKPLTPREYDQSIGVLLGVTQSLGKANLPSPPAAPFDNDALEFVVSGNHVGSYEYTATKVADAFLLSPTRAAYIPCVATGPSDRSCLEKFAIQLSSVAYRNVVTAAEIKPVVDLALASATQAANFNAGLKLVIQAVLQNPRFLYRFETGVLKDGLYELSATEYLSKVTFFLLGRSPTLKEIQEVNAGAFATASLKEAYIKKLIDDPALIGQMDTIHSQWMGYSELANQGADGGNFRTETKALVSRVITEGLPWSAVLTSKQTYANESLAKLYDLDDQTTAGWKWRTYKGDLRQGLLSQGSFLSVGVKFGDTSTTRRGYNMQKALFCGIIGRPPSVDENGVSVDIDSPPPSDTVYDCKEDLYRNTVLTRKNCAGCHNMMDSMAFGLENFGPDAGFRTTEISKPQCVIRGRGEVFVMSQTGMTKLGEFTGPKQLADLALQSGYIEKCLATRMVQYSIGRKPTAQDEAHVYNVYAMNKKATSFKEFLKNFVLSPEFSIRKGQQ